MARECQNHAFLADHLGKADSVVANLGTVVRIAQGFCRRRVEWKTQCHWGRICSKCVGDVRKGWETLLELETMDLEGGEEAEW